MVVVRWFNARLNAHRGITLGTRSILSFDVGRDCCQDETLSKREQKRFSIDVPVAFFVTSRPDVRRTDQVYPGRHRDLGNRTTSTLPEAILWPAKNPASSVNALRELRSAIARTLVRAVRPTGNRLPPLFQACNCRSSQ